MRKPVYPRAVIRAALARAIADLELAEALLDGDAQAALCSMLGRLRVIVEQENKP